MNGYQNMLEQKLSLLEKSFREGGVFDNSAGNVESLCAAFVSVCDTNERAFVFRAAESTPEEAWKRACEKSAEFVRRYDYAPVWIKADIMASRECIPFAELQKRISASRNEFFRRGIAFDERMESALIEAEINGNRVISYKKHMLELPVLNEYLAECGLPTLSGFPEEVTLFDCESRFCDDSCAVFPLYGSGSVSSGNSPTAPRWMSFPRRRNISQCRSEWTGGSNTAATLSTIWRYPGIISCGIPRQSGALSAPTA